eukprot:jgi/Botrbrau1/6413/Bobra.49_1s0029.1
MVGVSLEHEEDTVELTVFRGSETYVYVVPPASTFGHRAEMWNVDKWLKEVTCTVVIVRDQCFVRLFETDSGALFAECPVDNDKPLSAAVEPVVDSSRYFVLRVVDRESQRHAFLGIGFRERTQASDFNAALYEHTQRVRRARDAEDLRQRYEAAAGEGDQPPGSLQDYSLRPGETITLSLPKKQGPGKSTGGLLSRLASSSGTGEGKKCGEAEGATPLLLAPPPRAEGCTPALLAPPPQTEGGTPHLLAPHPRASAAADKTQNPNPVSAATGSHLPIGTAIGGRGSEGGAAPLLPPPPPPGVDASQPAAGSLARQSIEKQGPQGGGDEGEPRGAPSPSSEPPEGEPGSTSAVQNNSGEDAHVIERTPGAEKGDPESTDNDWGDFVA